MFELEQLIKNQSFPVDFNSNIFGGYTEIYYDKFDIINYSK